jgi:hypothetical protein
MGQFTVDDAEIAAPLCGPGACWHLQCLMLRHCTEYRELVCSNCTLWLLGQAALLWVTMLFVIACSMVAFAACSCVQQHSSSQDGCYARLMWSWVSNRCWRYYATFLDGTSSGVLEASIMDAAVFWLVP